MALMLPNADVLDFGLCGKEELEADAETRAGTDNSCESVIL